MRYVMARAWWRVRRPLTIGVRVALTDGSNVVLVRHAYADRQWYLPGGGVHRGESAVDAAIREVHEELGIVISADDLRLVGAFHSTLQGKSDHVIVFATGLPREALTLQPREIAEAGIFAFDELPPATSPATRRRIAELGASHIGHGRW